MDNFILKYYGKNALADDHRDVSSIHDIITEHFNFHFHVLVFTGLFVLPLRQTRIFL